MAYRNPLAWNRNLRPGLFVANPNAELPAADMGIHIGLYDGSLGGFDWLADENNTNFTYSDYEVDRMVAELEQKGYGDTMGDLGYGVGSEGVSYEMPQRRINIRIWRTH